MRKTSTAQIFLIHLQQSGNELPLSKMQKKLGRHRLRFRNKARGKLLQFNSTWPHWQLVEKY